MVLESERDNKISVSGTMFQAFVNAGESLRLLIWGGTDNAEIFDPDKWYPLETFQRLLNLTSRYKNPNRILEEIGAEMTKFWYEHESGKVIVKSSIDFLHYQTGADGFKSVIKGPHEITGTFELVALDDAKGFARIHSSTFFPRDMELGILYGGIGLFDDLIYYDVTFDHDSDCFDVFFVTSDNMAAVNLCCGEDLEIHDWRLRHSINQSRRKETFWQCINETLNSAFLEMKEAMDKAKILRGLLPICSSCKKIRDDKGYWTKLEHYISMHSDADFSHSICPECAKRLYPDYIFDRSN